MKLVPYSENKMGVSENLHENAFSSSSYDVAVPGKP
jgi:hypothetical protein